MYKWTLARKAKNSLRLGEDSTVLYVLGFDEAKRLILKEIMFGPLKSALLRIQRLGERRKKNQKQLKKKLKNQ